MDKKTMDGVKQTFKDKGKGRSTSRCYGICYNEPDERVIYINMNNRKRKHKQYKGVKYTAAYTREHKTTYRDISHTLVHELVHYRWKMNHGKCFEKRIREILHGKVFPQKKLYEDADNANTLDNKSVPITETMTPDEYNQKVSIIT